MGSMRKDRDSKKNLEKEAGSKGNKVEWEKKEKREDWEDRKEVERVVSMKAHCVRWLGEAGFTVISCQKPDSSR